MLILAVFIPAGLSLRYRYSDPLSTIFASQLPFCFACVNQTKFNSDFSHFKVLHLAFIVFAILHVALTFIFSPFQLWIRFCIISRTFDCSWARILKEGLHISNVLACADPFQVVVCLANITPCLIDKGRVEILISLIDLFHFITVDKGLIGNLECFNLIKSHSLEAIHLSNYASLRF